MSLLTAHLEKVVTGLVVAACAGVAVVELGGAGARGVSLPGARADAAALEQAVAATTAPAGKVATAGLTADAALAAFTAVPGPVAEARRWTFFRRPTVRGKEITPPDPRKILAPPRNPTAAHSDFTVTLRWEDDPETTAAVTGYRVYRLDPTGARPPAPTAEVPAGTREWLDRDAAVLGAEQSVRYVVTAVTMDETRLGRPESDPSAEAQVTLPYDREVVYHGASYPGARGRTAALVVRRFFSGKWIEAEFDVEEGKVIGGVKRVTLEAGGTPQELDFTTKWTLKRVEKFNGIRVVDGKQVAIDESWVILADAAGIESRIDKQPAVAGPPVGPRARDPLSPLIFDLAREIETARKAGKRDEAARLQARREWLTAEKAKWWSDAKRALRTEKVDDAAAALESEKATAVEAKDEPRVAECDARLALIAKVRAWK